MAFWNKKNENRIKQAEAYLERTHSAAGHYHMKAVVDSVRQWTAVKDFSVKEAVQAVNNVRKRRGWMPVQPEEILSTDPDVDFVYCLRCRIEHTGGQC